MGRAAKSAATRQRLLDAGVEVFAEEGFRNATLERICRQAKANIAAAHYHFGGKDELYAAVFEYAGRRVADEPAPELAGAPPADRLRLQIGAFLARLLDPARAASIARLVAREMIEPTPILDRLVRRRVRATHEQLAAAVRALLGAGASPDAVRLCTLSIVAQCVFYRHSAAVLARLYPDLVPEREVERIADHVTRFSLAALRGLRVGREECCA